MQEEVEPQYFSNTFQSQEFRRYKYDLIRACGVSSYTAMRLRDWHLNSIEHWLAYPLGLVGHQMRLWFFDTGIAKEILDSLHRE